MASDGYAAVIVGRSPHIVRCLTYWGQATAVTITGQADSGYAVAVAGSPVGQRRTLREAMTLACQAHLGTGGEEAPGGQETAAGGKPGKLGGIVGRILSNDLSAGLMQAAIGFALLMAFVGGCIAIPGMSP